MYIDFPILNQPCIPEINLTWSGCVIFYVYICHAYLCPFVCNLSFLFSWLPLTFSVYQWFGVIYYNILLCHLPLIYWDWVLWATQIFQFSLNVENFQLLPLEYFFFCLPLSPPSGYFPHNTYMRLFEDVVQLTDVLLYCPCFLFVSVSLCITSIAIPPSLLFFPACLICC